MSDTRGQAHALEGVLAALLVFLGLFMAMQVTIITPLAASTANQHIGNQIQSAANGVLTTAAEDEELRPALLSWNETGARFYDARDLGYYATGGPPNEFGERLNETFGNHDVAFNVNLAYLSESGDRQVIPLVHLGKPADNAITATRTVTLYDGDQLYTADGKLSDTELRDSESFYAPDRFDGPMYNVVEIEVVVWQM